MVTTFQRSMYDCSNSTKKELGLGEINSVKMQQLVKSS